MKTKADIYYDDTLIPAGTPVKQDAGGDYWALPWPDMRDADKYWHQFNGFLLRPGEVEE